MLYFHYDKDKEQRQTRKGEREMMTKEQYEKWLQRFETEPKDKLHRKNMQIKELKKQVRDLEIALTTMQGAYKGIKED